MTINKTKKSFRLQGWTFITNFSKTIITKKSENAPCKVFGGFWLPLWWHSLKSMVVFTLSVQICNLLVWIMWSQFAMWCMQHDLMQIKSISSKTTSHEQNLLSQTYKSLLQWRNSAKKPHEIRKVMGTRARKDALERSFKLLCFILWKPLYNMNLKLHLDIPDRFGKLKKYKKLQSL